MAPRVGPRIAWLSSALALAALVIVVCAAGTAWGAQDAGSLVIKSTSTREYPRVTLRVGVPSEIQTEAQPAFTVKENGQSAPVLSVVPDEGELPFEVVLVIDTSARMKDAPLGNAHIAARRFIRRLPEQASVAIVGVSSEPTLIAGFTSDKTSLNRALNGMSASGEAALYDSLFMAARLKGTQGLAGPRRERTIVLIADGGDTTSVTTLDQIVRELRKDSTPLIAVAISSSDFNQQALQLLTRQTGGRLISVPNSGELSPQLKPLAKQVSTGYAVTYRSSRPPTKDLEVDVQAAAGTDVASLSTVIPNPLFVVHLPLPTKLYATQTANKTLLWAAVIAVAACVALIGVAIVMTLMRSGRRLGEVKYYDQLRAQAQETGEDHDSVQARLVDAVEAVASKHGFAGVIARKLDRAGIALRPAEWISVHLAAVIVLGFLVQVVGGNLAISIIAVLLLAWGPLAYLDRRGNKRTLAFEEQLPDALNLLAGGLRTGWGLQQSMELVVNESPAPTSEEFRRSQVEARLGVPLERSLLNIQDRVQSDPFEWAVAAISIQREVGGNLAEVLDSVAVSIRDRQSLLRFVSSLTAEGRFSALILSILPFVVVGVLLVVNRDYILSALLSPIGWMMVGLALMLLLAGILWLRSISRIEY